MDSGISLTLPKKLSMTSTLTPVSLLQRISGVLGTKTQLTRLIWCHTASTAVLSVNLKNHSKAYVHASVPQATVLMAFRSVSTLFLSVRQLCEVTGLNLNEIQQLVASLSHEIAPLLMYHPICTNQIKHASTAVYTTPPRSASQSSGKASYNGNTPSPHQYLRKNSQTSSIPSTGVTYDDSFSVNENLMKGILGGLSESFPLVTAPEGLSVSSSSDSLLAAAGGTRYLRSWRNELIDACIVRILKVAARTTIER